MSESTVVHDNAAARPRVFVHSSSFIDEPCQIGHGTKIWHFSHIMKSCRIGQGCNIGQNVVVSPDVTIGNNVKIQNNVSVYTGCILEDDVFCGPSMVFTKRDQSQKPRRAEGRIQDNADQARCVAGSQLHRDLRYHHWLLCLRGRGRVGFRDVPDYALVFGNPCAVPRLVCACGIKIDFGGRPDTHAKCSACGAEHLEERGGCASGFLDPAPNRS